MLVGILLSNLSKEIALMLAHLQPQVTVRPVGLVCVCVFLLLFFYISLTSLDKMLSKRNYMRTLGHELKHL